MREGEEQRRRGEAPEGVERAQIGRVGQQAGTEATHVLRFSVSTNLQAWKAVSSAGRGAAKTSTHVRSSETCSNSAADPEAADERVYPACPSPSSRVLVDEVEEV